jgi:hypothetical protein
MAKDAELDRLKIAQDLAFSRKQSAYNAQEAAWKRRKAAGDRMHTAFEEKDRAYRAQQSAWEDLQRLRDSKRPRIEQLNRLQEAAFQNMRSSYDSASAAYDRRDGASAKSYAEQGRAYKAESQGYVEERRRLVAELRSASDHQKSYAPAFQASKASFDSKKREFDVAKAAHEQTQIEFKAAKEALDKMSSAFKARLEVVRAQNARIKNDKRSIAEKAGVPFQYLDKVYTSKDASGNTNIYFGGIGEPNGPGHGHYVVDRSGMVTYKRDPFDPHGAENFEDEKEAALLYTRSARNEHMPAGINEHGGVFWKRDSNQVLHVTQYFADLYHVSWDATPSGNQNIHWTNKNVPKGHPERFTAPPDASLR